MADSWQVLGGQGVGLVDSIRDEGFSNGVLEHVAKWDPVLFGPAAEGILAGQDADAREAALGAAPKFEIPSSYDEYTAMMKERTQQDMPGMDIMSDEIRGQAAANATGVSQLSSGPQAIMGASSVYNNQSSQLRDLGLGASQWEQEQQLGYMGSQQEKAGLEQQQFEYNEWLPWQIAKNEIASLRYAGQGMSASGSDQMAATGMQAASMFSK